MARPSFSLTLRQMPLTVKIRVVALYGAALGVVFAAGWAIGGLVWLQFQPKVIERRMAATRESAAGPVWELYLPVRSPLANGLQHMTPIP